MSKKNKPGKEEMKHEEVKTEALETGSMDAAGVIYVPCRKTQKSMSDLAHELRMNIEELKDFNPDHHNKMVIDLSVNSALESLAKVIGQLAFIEKAISEKQK